MICAIESKETSTYVKMADVVLYIVFNVLPTDHSLTDGQCLLHLLKHTRVYITYKGLHHGKI